MQTRLTIPVLGAVLCLASVGFGGSPALALSHGHDGPQFVYNSPEQIGEAQGILQHLGYLKQGSYQRGTLDNATRGALQSFQRTHTLRQTGQVDGDTLAELLQHEPPIVGGPLALRGVLFDAGSAQLKSKAQADLDGVARSLRSNPHVRLSIEGHSDSSGTTAWNQHLSKARADAVRDYLVSKGVPPSRLETRARGSRQPVADNDTIEGRAENRRVELARAG